MLNQWRINAKQLTAAPHDVFKLCLAVRQTDMTFYCQTVTTEGLLPPAFTVRMGLIESSDRI